MKGPLTVTVAENCRKARKSNVNVQATLAEFLP
jgi:ribosomal protein L30E